MDNGDQPVLMYRTFAKLDDAKRVGDALVAGRLAACVNIVPGVQSIYAWQGTVQQDQECLLYIKTRAERYAALEEALRRHHPYELPEIVAVPVDSGLPGYLHWVVQETRPHDPEK